MGRNKEECARKGHNRAQNRNHSYDPRPIHHRPEQPSQIDLYFIIFSHFFFIHSIYLHSFFVPIEPLYF